MNTSRQPRDAFTLVELLVVVLIIAMLMGLLTPAILAARGRSRITQCTNNHKNLSAALVEYELAKQQFPGYVNRVSGSPNPASWPVMILQRIDRADVWDAWRSGDDEPVKVPLFVCPGRAAANPAPLSYVANCGQQDSGIVEHAVSGRAVLPDWPANGVFHNRLNANPMATVGASDIKDGTQHTLLISENNQAGSWCKTPQNTLDTLPGTTTNVQEPSWGMVWWKNNDTKVLDVNEDYDDDTTDYDHARPSSYHAGGVVATFCDGHSRFVSDEIDYNVYALLMTPDGAKAKSTKTGNSMPGQTTKLDESMLK